jgi:hypothetical protein
VSDNDREALGRRVRELWAAHAAEHPPPCRVCGGAGTAVAPAPYGLGGDHAGPCDGCGGAGYRERAAHLAPWGALSEWHRELCRVIGEALAREAAAAERAACLALVIAELRHAREQGAATDDPAAQATWRAIERWCDGLSVVIAERGDEEP